MNKVVLIGNLVRDPELKYLDSGKAVCNFTLAVKDRFNKDKTDFIDCTAWGKTAEISGEYLKKGNKVAVAGSLSTRSYENKDGQKVKLTFINVDEVELPPKGSSQPKDDFADIGREVDGDIPF
jgi:single-strand DNA-binding protein